MEDEDRLLRSVALRNARSIQLARQQAEEELLRTREALRESQERLTTALAASGTGTFRWNLRSNVVEWDGNLNRLFGLQSDGNAQSLDAFIAAVHPEDRPGVLARYERCAREGGDFDSEFRVVWPDGSIHWIDEKARTVVDATGLPLYVTGACADVTIRKQAADALLESGERLRAIFNSAAVGIAIAALDGRFLDMNGKFTEILGYTYDELCHLTFTDITHPEDRGETAIASRELLAGLRSDYALEKRYVRKDGSSIWILATVSLLRDALGAPYRFIGVVENIAARKEAEAALRRADEERQALLERERAARAAAERLSELKDEFLATLSHELRTPLNAILGWARILRNGARDETDRVKGLETIERNARAQSQLVDDLLDMSRITSGKLRLDIQPVQPVTFIEAALETVRPAAQARGLRLEKVLDPAAGPVAGDPGRLQQVVWNLLSNAIKFTPKDGKVQVMLQCVDSHIEISVADTGVGIRPEFLPHLFERFRQGDASTTRNYSGLGLGLSIVKSLVELHGGTVSVRSPGEGMGTTATVQLPLTVIHRSPDRRQRVHPRTPMGDPVAVAASELAGLKVLVVDDQADARDLIRRVLEDCAADVVTAASAEEALLLVEAERPHVLVSDIGMPGADGFELLRQVRALGTARGGRVPAIALTAFARSEDRTNALRAGFLVHVSKPVDPSELVATVASVAGRFRDPR